MLLDPADVRFTQDSISLYFHAPYDYFSIRDAVRSISKGEMTPDDFPSIRVISYNGCLWSIDNRRLWVFRFARCRSISVRLGDETHYRLSQIISNRGLLRMMEAADFFPRVRDKGDKDLDFDLLYPQPSSLRPSKNCYNTIIKAQAHPEAAEFVPKVSERGDKDRCVNRLFSQLSSFQPSRSYDYTINNAQEHAEAAKFFPKVLDREDTDPGFHRLPPQLASFQPSRSHDYTVSKAKDHADNNTSGVTATPQTPSTIMTQEHTEGVDCFPRVHDRGDKDRDYNCLYPYPSSFQHGECIITVAQDHADNKFTSVIATPQTLSTRTAREHADNKNTSGIALPETPSTSREHTDNKTTPGTASPQTRSTSTSQVHVDIENTSVTASPQTSSNSTAEDHGIIKITAGTASSQTSPTSPAEDNAESWAVTPREQCDGFLKVIWSAAKKTINVAGIAASRTVSVARKIKNTFCRIFVH